MSVGLVALAAACAATSEEAEDEATAGDESAVIDRSQPALTHQRLEQIAAPLRSLDQLPAQLPKDFLINFTLKHGRLFEGPRGHLVERVVSQSSSPTAPRAILWDERSGLMISYNGGAAGQTEPNRLDVIDFDANAKTFKLTAAQFGNGRPPVWQSNADIAEASRKCTTCHGPEHRPIFSMYPDWPSFYGSDNDELTSRTNHVQERELEDYGKFRREVATRSLPRYTPLFDAANVRAQLRGTQIYASYPYRPNLDTNIEAVSRSFAFRPSLRLGILANRLMAQAATKRIVDHENFDKFGPLFLHDLLECRSSTTTNLWKDSVRSAIGRAPRTVVNNQTLHYRDLLAIFDLEVRDIDIRYSYNHEGYKNDDASRKVMEVGYIDGYWNSYFDGSATIDELIAMQLYKHLAATSTYADLRGTIDNPDGLVVKYQRRTERFKFDRNFFEEMDRKGEWIPIPYPLAKLNDVHHREGYPSRFSTQHRNLCAKLDRHLARGPGSSTGPVEPPPSADACPANCVASSYCVNHPNASQAIKVDGLPCMVAGAGGCQPCR
ncbi:MAG: hypothetical protein KIT84_08130 [Labilithrix sp.]|nr:hypothetical protein [Labilithrix sp.]MCW5810965.1 hypothetical protein [Labilithrix sp.]